MTLLSRTARTRTAARTTNGFPARHATPMRTVGRRRAHRSRSPATITPAATRDQLMEHIVDD